jgi:hypothetical protein
MNRKHIIKNLNSPLAVVAAKIYNSFIKKNGKQNETYHSLPAVVA